jgi:hypothetical protein
MPFLYKFQFSILNSTLLVVGKEEDGSPMDVRRSKVNIIKISGPDLGYALFKVHSISNQQWSVGWVKNGLRIHVWWKLIIKLGEYSHVARVEPKIHLISSICFTTKKLSLQFTRKYSCMYKNLLNFKMCYTWNFESLLYPEIWAPNIKVWKLIKKFNSTSDCSKVTLT